VQHGKKKGKDSKALLNTATKKFETAALSDTRNPLYFLQWGNALTELGKISPANGDEIFKMAYYRYKTVVEIDPQYYQGYLRWAIALLEHSKQKLLISQEKREKLLIKAAQQFDRAIEISESCADDLIEQSLEEQRVKISDLFFIALNASLLLQRINHIQRRKQLQSMDLMNSVPSAQAFDCMCATFGSSLRQIVLSNSPADHMFMESLAKCINLTSIQLDNCNALRDNDILLLTQGCKMLQAIDLSHTCITDIAIGYIATNIPNLRRIKLSQCDKLTDNALRYLCGCSQLEELHLSRLKIHKEIFQELIQDCTNLKKLDISYCLDLDSSSIADLAKYNTSLVYLDLGGLNVQSSAICDLAAQCKQLETLSFFYAGAGKDSVDDSAICCVANNCKSLKKLNLYRCHNVTDKSLEYLAASCSNLQHLDLSYCVKITDHGIHVLAEKMTQLRTLSLQGLSNITDGSIRKLTANCTKLVELDISRTSVAPSAIQNRENIKSLHYSVRGKQPSRPIREPAHNNT